MDTFIKKQIDKKCFLLFYFRKTAEMSFFLSFLVNWANLTSDLESVKTSVGPKVDLKLLHSVIYISSNTGCIAGKTAEK